MVKEFSCLLDRDIVFIKSCVTLRESILESTLELAMHLFIVMCSYIFMSRLITFHSVQFYSGS